MDNDPEMLDLLDLIFLPQHLRKLRTEAGRRAAELGRENAKGKD